MPRFHEVPNSVSFPQLEHRVLERWRTERTFERSLEQRASGPVFVFYDGPPFATGRPHYGHILTSFIKDVVPRYYTMRGHHVPRRWAWDCHGLPGEYEVEKALGVSSRAAILEHGVTQFNAACRSLVMRYAGEWESVVERLGRWVDFRHAYKTMDPEFVESVVWAFKTLHERGLVYEGEKVVAYCTRCQTALSNFEARLDDAFRSRDDMALTVCFALVDRPAESLLAWTTTPWTLPSNVALAVHPGLEYTRMARGESAVWLSTAALPRFRSRLEGSKATTVRLGAELVGWRYQPLFPGLASSTAAFQVVATDFVTADEGTGVVHLAPAFGEDDQAACAAHGIEGPNPVGDDGTFDERLGELAGLSVFEANEPIAKRLRVAGALFARETHRHNYPHCWRCDSPLIYRAVPSWFVRVSAFKDRMAKLNRRIHWVPPHVGEGRFADWLQNARDWAVSRNRFWGAPVPVWRCDRCRSIHVVGSRAEVEALAGAPLADWHRPEVDAVTWSCAHCSGTMRRVADVLDCWFESGAMPYGQAHYPFENASTFERSFPGDFIVEYVAQTRGWFYTMLALSTALFDTEPFKHAVCHGVLLGHDGRKMSKRLKNYPDPLELVEEHGSDALRAALLMSGAVSGADICFSEAAVRDSVRRFHISLWNVIHLFTAYAALDGFEPAGRLDGASRLDRYLLAESDALRSDVEGAMERYDFAAVYRALDDFLAMLSTWYLRLTKAELWKPGLDDAKRASYEALYAALHQLVTVAAPFLPFLAEAAYEALGQDASVHLADWPPAREEWHDQALVEEMRTLQHLVHLARKVREGHGIRHRHPLRRAAVAGLAPAAVEANRSLLEAELNVKEVTTLADVDVVARREIVLDYPRLGKRLRGAVKEVARALATGDCVHRDDGRLEAAGQILEPGEFSVRYVARDPESGVAADGPLVVALDLARDEALVREGQARDLNRAVQELRRQAGLAYDDRVELSLVADAALLAELAPHEKWLADQCLAVAVRHLPMPDALAQSTVEVDGRSVEVALARTHRP